MDKTEAVNQFIRRRKKAIEQGIIDNSSKPAGSPMRYYCWYCGILTEVLPEDYIFPPNKKCSQCVGLLESNLMKEAMSLAIELGLYTPNTEKYYGA